MCLEIRQKGTWAGVAVDAYWREHYREQPFAADERRHEDFALAYRAGYTGYCEGATFDEREADLRMAYGGG